MGKSRFHDEKKIIKELLKEKAFEVDVNTTFEEFATVVSDDKRSHTLDGGNVKLTYNALLEKAEARDKEKMKEENRRMKKLENAFRALLKTKEVDHVAVWDESRAKLEGDPAFDSITLESERVRIFKDYQRDMEESCGHHHSRSKKNKKKDKKQKRRSSSSKSPSTARSESRSKSRSKSRSRSKSMEEEQQVKEVNKVDREEAFPAPTPKKNKKNRNGQEKKSKEDGEWSEDELERKRRVLLEQLAEEHQ